MHVKWILRAATVGHPLDPLSTVAGGGRPPRPPWPEEPGLVLQPHLVISELLSLAVALSCTFLVVMAPA